MISLAKNGLYAMKRQLPKVGVWAFFSVLMLGSLPVQAAASVAISQTPLAIRDPIPPNIVFILDDSGSMGRDYMPDWGYLRDTSDLAVINSEINGVYYNPAVRYAAPPKANGGSYPNSSFSSAWYDGFDRDNTYDLDSFSDTFDYSITVSGAGVSSYEALSSCPANTKSSGSQPGYCYFTPDSARNNSGEWVDFKWFYDDEGDYTYYRSKCSSDNDVYVHSGNRCYSDTDVDVLEDSWDDCDRDKKFLGRTRVDYDEQRKVCSASKERNYRFFTYSTLQTPGDLTSGYKRHYVSNNAGDCAAAGLSSNVCVDSSQDTPAEVTDPSVPSDMNAAEVLQNVANWFSYYHTRMLMAKSSSMQAFSTMDKDFRFGYVAINSAEYGKGNIYDVAEFGTGTSGSQKAKFWNWLQNEPPSGGTPLRRALKAAGEYYSTAGPWKSDKHTQPLSCRQSYTILTTDGFWNGGNPSVGDADSNEGEVISGPNNPSFQYEPKAPFEGSTNNTLADVAMHYWNQDLRPSNDMKNDVPINDADPAFWQHMVTFTIGMGFLPPYDSKSSYDNPYMDKDMVDGLFSWSKTGDKPASLADWDGWLKPSSDSVNNINDLVHAGVNGHGGFFSATSPEKFTQALTTALNRAKKRMGSAASVAANSTQLKTGSTVYQSVYHSAIWTGDLKAIGYDSSTKELSSTATWSAADKMPAPTDRHIYTLGSGNSMVTFTPGNQSQFVATTTLSDDMVQYLRGDDNPGYRTEGWRQRLTPLGDIVHSQPIYVGDMKVERFSKMDFAGADQVGSVNSSRAGRIYVAANDGMLHAFNPSNGKETFAYLPAAVIDAGLSVLADQDYGKTSNPHKYFNDGSMTISDVYIGGSWHTVLVGTTGRSEAKAIYALDITDPNSISLLWERSAEDGKTNSDYIGQMITKPIVVQVEDGDWVALIGNGYNSAQGKAALLQFDLDDGSLDVYKTNATTGNGLASPAVWIEDTNNMVGTEAYAGDLMGNVWQFDLDKNGGNDGTKLFVAKDGSGNTQPITTQMIVKEDPDTGNRWVFFGTGKYMASTDRSDSSIQTWYGLIVDSAETDRAVTSADTRIDLAKREIFEQIPATSDALAKRVISLAPNTKGATTANTAESINGKPGWFIDLTPENNAKGEKMVQPNQLVGGLLLGTTRVSVSGDPCSPSSTGWVMAVDPFTGTNPANNFFDTNGDGSVDNDDKAGKFDTNGDGSVDNDDKAGKYVSGGVGFSSDISRGTVLDTTMVFNKNGELERLKFKPQTATLSVGSWREVIAQ